MGYNTQLGITALLYIIVVVCKPFMNELFKFQAIYGTEVCNYMEAHNHSSKKKFKHCLFCMSLGP